MTILHVIKYYPKDNVSISCSLKGFPPDLRTKFWDTLLLNKMLPIRTNEALNAMKEILLEYEGPL